MKPQNFINNAWVASSSGETIPVIDPSTGEVFAEIARGTAQDIDQAVQAAHAPEICRAGFDGRQHAGRRGGIPAQNVTLKRGVFRAIRQSRTGGGGGFPFRNCRQSLALPLRERFRGKPRDPDDGLVRLRVGAGFQIACPMFEIIVVGKNPFHLRAPPARIGADELQIFRIRDRHDIEVKTWNRHVRRIGQRTEQRAKDGVGNTNHVRRRRLHRRARKQDEGGGANFLTEASHCVEPGLLEPARSWRRRGRGFDADFRHVRRADSIAGVAPGIAHIRQDVGDLIIGEVGQRDHRAFVGLAVHDRLARAADDDGADGVLLVLYQEIRFRQRRDLSGHAEAGGLVAHEAGLHVNRLPFFDLDVLGQAGDLRVAFDFGGHLRLQFGDFLFRIRTGLRRAAEINRIYFLAGIHQQIRRAGNFQHAKAAFVECAEQGVIHEDERAGHVHLELHDGRAARWNQRGLHIMLRGHRAAFLIDIVKNFTDDVE